jgi:hypothetical protein
MECWGSEKPITPTLHYSITPRFPSSAQFKLDLILVDDHGQHGVADHFFADFAVAFFEAWSVQNPIAPSGFYRLRSANE